MRKRMCEAVVVRVSVDKRLGACDTTAGLWCQNLARYMISCCDLLLEVESVGCSGRGRSGFIIF